MKEPFAVFEVVLTPYSEDVQRVRRLDRLLARGRAPETTTVERLFESMHCLVCLRQNGVGFGVEGSRISGLKGQLTKATLYHEYTHEKLIQ